MNHQIQHDVDVRAAMLEWREPGGLDEPRHGKYGLQRLDGGVEALQVSNLQNPLGTAGRVDQADALFHGRGHRLLDQHVRSGLEELLGHGEVIGRRRDDAHCIDAAQEFAIVRVSRHAQFCAHRIASGSHRVRDAHQLGIF